MKGFIQFSMDYYREKVAYYEKDSIAKEDLYEAKQLLKAVDDVVDEGYHRLYDSLEEEKLVTRLRKLLKDNGEEPFKMPERIENVDEYGVEEHELSSYLEKMMSEGKISLNKSDNAFIGDLLDFCKWVGYEEDTAYVFLLRDTLLPYLYYKEKGCKNLYPWLIGRKFLDSIAGEEGFDDDFRYPIFNASNEKIGTYEEFIKYCRKDILETLTQIPEVKNELKKLLQSIKQDKIVVIESGCYGTFPVLLASMDERVSIKMFTAVPFLWQQYGEHIYTKAYEKNRDFETLYSQDVLLKYASYKDGKFYVNVNKNTEVYEKAMAEVKAVL